MSKLIFLVVLLSGVPWCIAGPQDNVYQELRNFSVGKSQLPEDYVKSFPELIHNAIIQEELVFQSQYSAQGKCNSYESKVDIQFEPLQSDTTDQTIKEFESGVIKIVSSKCLINADPDKAIQILNDFDFKKSAFSTLKGIQKGPQEGVVCELTEAFTIGLSHYCYQLSVESDPAKVYVRSHMLYIWNNPDLKQFSAPIYHSEVFMSAKKMQNDTVVHMITYIRPSTLNSFQKLFVKGVVKSTQEGVFMKLQTLLQKK